MDSNKLRLDQRHILALAARAEVDPRTARAFLEGRPSRWGCIRARLEDAARELDLTPASSDREVRS